MSINAALVFGDTHVPFHDKRAWNIISSISKDLQPDCVVHIGDLLDCWQISDFDKDPARRSTLQDDIDVATGMLKTLQTQAPDAKYWLLEGNHEDRLRRLIWRMTDKQRELAHLRAFQEGINWPSLLGLNLADDTGWTFVHAQGQARTRILPKFITKHGQIIRKWSGASAKAEWERYGKSGLSGHTHRLGLFYTNDYNGSHVWAETGCTCLLQAEYVEDPCWQQGCAVITYVGDRFAVELVYIQNGVAVWRGKEYRG